jgi:hypothetical protein
MSLLLKYGGPKVSFVVGLLVVLVALGSLFRIREFTVRDFGGWIVMVMLGVSCLAVSRNAMKRD